LTASAAELRNEKGAETKKAPGGAFDVDRVEAQAFLFGLRGAGASFASA
jgi:hypothetical protein